MSEIEGHVEKEIRIYLAVFASLMVLTIATVAAWWIGHRLGMSTLATVSVGLLIAVLKGSLVALFFMHLSNEKRFIYTVLLFTAVFFFAVLLLPLFALYNSNALPQHLYSVESSE